MSALQLKQGCAVSVPRQPSKPSKPRNQPSAQALALLDVNSRPVTLPGKKGHLSEKTVLEIRAAYDAYYDARGVWFRFKQKHGANVIGQIARRETYKWIRG